MINVLKSVYFLTTSGNNKIGNSYVKLNDILKNCIQEFNKNIKDNINQINILIDCDLITDYKNNIIQKFFIKINKKRNNS